MGWVRERMQEGWQWASDRLALYRAHLLAFAGLLLGFLEVLDPWALSAVLPDRWVGVSMIGLAVGIWLLRKIAANDGGLQVPREEWAGTTEEPPQE